MSALVEVRLPQLSMGMAEAEVVELAVVVGDVVSEGQDLLSVEAEKTVQTLPAPVAGVVTAVTCEVGDVLDVRALLIVIESRP